MDINCDDAAEVANLEVPVAKFYKDDFKLHRRGLSHITVISPNRIYMPSLRSQWRKYECGKRKINATGAAVRADLFYWDGLYPY